MPSPGPPILACPPLAKAAKPCRDISGSSASQFSILALQKQGQVCGVLVAQSRTGTSPCTLISAVQLSSCSLAPSCFRVDTRGGGGSTMSPRDASPGATGEEEEPRVQAACWPAARQRPRLVRHAWPQLRCPGQQAPPWSLGAGPRQDGPAPGRCPEPEEGGPGGSCSGPAGLGVAKGPEVKHRPFKASPPWAWNTLAQKGDSQTDGQTGRQPHGWH